MSRSLPPEQLIPLGWGQETFGAKRADEAGLDMPAQLTGGVGAAVQIHDPPPFSGSICGGGVELNGSRSKGGLNTEKYRPLPWQGPDAYC